MKRRPLLLLASLGLVAVLACLVVAFALLQAELDRPLRLPQSGMVLEVERGETLSHIARQLRRDGILRYAEVLLLGARLQGDATIQAGEYRLSAGDTPRTLLSRLTAGEVIQYSITFAEGRSIREWKRDMDAHNAIAASADFSISALAEMVGFDSSDNPEGWFFPDTYSFSRGVTDYSLFERAHRKMKEVLQREWEYRAEGLPYERPYDALIMASIVEKETGLAEERDEIAGVFVRRLQKGMRLQTDPTVIYGLGSRYGGNLKRDHLSEPSPYNTYLNRGLPPTPISNPGRDAIHAALHPDNGSALYFVAKGDGSHHFSDTLEEHQKAVRKFQLQRRSDYRSAPR